MNETNGTPVAATTIVRRYEPKATVLIRQVEDLVVSNDEEDQVAANLLVKVRGMYKEADAEKKKITDPLNQALTATRALFERILGPLGKSDKIVNQKIGDYRTAKKRKHDEEQRQKREEEESAAEAAQKKLLEKAEKAEGEGKFDKAEDLRDQAATVPAGLFGVEEKVELRTRTELRGGGSKVVTGNFDIRVSVAEPWAENARLVLQEILAGKLPIGAVEFKVGVLKSHIKQNALKSVPGLAITEVYVPKVM
jgi:hypothetical protein